MDKYEKMRKIGSGSYGYVYKCRNRETGEIVAIKKFLETEDDPTIQKITFREIRVLMDLHHPNIVNLVEMFRKKRKLHLVFEFCTGNLLDLMNRYPDGMPELVGRDILHQLLQALNHMHRSSYVHRDVKPENILLRGSTVKLCDFGFARPVNRVNPTDFESRKPFTITGVKFHIFIDDCRRLEFLRKGYLVEQSLPQFYTDYVATRWYRAPELLVGEPLYGPNVDVWATGCVYAEYMTGEPLWPGTTDLDQLFLIRKTLGEIPESYIRLFENNSFFQGAGLSPLPEELESLDKRVPKLSKSSFQMLQLMVTMDAKERPSAEALLKHAYFNGLTLAETVPRHKLTHLNQMYTLFKRVTADDHAKECLPVKYSISKHSTLGPQPPELRDLFAARKKRVLKNLRQM